MPLSVATVVAKNYLAHARTLAASFLKHHPDGRVFLLLVDRPEGYFDPAKEKFTLHELEELRGMIENFDAFTFQYGVSELSTAAKPFFFQFLFEKYGMDKLLYIDPDILITRPLDKIEKLLNDHSIVLTPHLTAPIDDTVKAGEIHILQTGAYNLGFLGMRRDENTGAMLRWWGKRLLKYCVFDKPAGYFVDQKWMDLVPGLFEGVHLLRDPGYNVAFWNLYDRTITKAGEEFLCNGEPLYFFHFSGFRPEKTNWVTKHWGDGLTRAQIGSTVMMYEMYENLLKENGYYEMKNWPYFYGNFDNGVDVAYLIRQIYRDQGDGAGAFGNPFLTAPDKSFYRWLTTPNGGKLSPLLLTIYEARPDLQRAFPAVEGRDRESYFNWSLTEGVNQFGLDKRLIVDEKAPPRTSLSTPLPSEVREAPPQEPKRGYEVEMKLLFLRLALVVPTDRPAPLPPPKKISFLNVLTLHIKPTTGFNEDFMARLLGKTVGYFAGKAPAARLGKKS